MRSTMSSRNEEKLEEDLEELSESKFEEGKEGDAGELRVSDETKEEKMDSVDGVVNQQCKVCGDEVEMPGHNVCFWHALTLKSNDGYALHEPEAMYSLNQYSGNVDAYLGRVGQKREDTLNSMLRGTRPLGNVRPNPSCNRTASS